MTTVAIQQKELVKDPVLETFLPAILATEAVQRLKGISFLGAIAWSGRASADPSLPMSRYAHSLGVAELASQVARARGFSRDLHRHVVCAALLHDIGHPPLSHSLEGVIRERWGQDHHSLGLARIRGETADSGKLNSLLRHFVDIDFIEALVSGRCGEEGGELFSASLNIDTIDGICRTARWAGLTWGDRPATPSAVAHAAHVEAPDDAALEIMDAFWQLKHRVYNDFIFTPESLVADVAGRVCMETHTGFSLEDMLSDEHSLEQRFAGLFSAIRHPERLDPELLELPVVRPQRMYRIGPKRQPDVRYYCTRTQSTSTLSALMEERKGGSCHEEGPALPLPATC